MYAAFAAVTAASYCLLVCCRLLAILTVLGYHAIKQWLLPHAAPNIRSAHAAIRAHWKHPQKQVLQACVCPPLHPIHAITKIPFESKMVRDQETAAARSCHRLVRKHSLATWAASRGATCTAKDSEGSESESWIIT